MGLQPIIRQDDVDLGGDKQVATQTAVFLDEDGNILTTGSITAGEGGSRAVGGTVILSGGTVIASGGGGVVEVNYSGGDVYHQGAGGRVWVNTKGETNVYINSPVGGNTRDCAAELIQSTMEGFSGINENGAVSDGEGGHRRAGPEAGGCANSYSPGGGNSFGVSLEGAADGTTAEPNTIVQMTIPVNADTGEVNEELELGPGTEEEPAPTTTSWTMTGATDGLTLDESTGVITGTIPEESEQFITVTATDATTGVDLDSKGYQLYRKKVTDQKMIAPMIVDYKIDSFFGKRKRPCPKCSNFHRGWDYNKKGTSGNDDLGETIVATLDGKVTFSGNLGGYGQTVILDHYDADGKAFMSTQYSHMTGGNQVAVGSEVSQGQQVGELGNTGNGTAAHLHYGVSLKPFGTYGWSATNDEMTDPGQYMNGENITIATQGGGAGTTYKTVSRDGLYVGGGQDAGCSAPVQEGSGNCASLGDARNGVSGNTTCTESLSIKQVIERMDAVFDKHEELDEHDRELLHFMARIESTYDPCIKNKQGSSAYGLFQMVDDTAAGYPHNRSNVEESTEAQIDFYQKELLPYYNYFQTSNGAGFAKTLPIRSNSLREKYKKYNKTEMIYGLLHHDGVGNAQKGVNMGGVAYVQKRMREFG